jgi:hypothetical protein
LIRSFTKNSSSYAGHYYTGYRNPLQKLRLSDKKTSPERAANAGSKLIKILKVFAGSFFNATISRKW